MIDQGVVCEVQGAPRGQKRLYGDLGPIAGVLERIADERDHNGRLSL